MNRLENKPPEEESKSFTEKYQQIEESVINFKAFVIRILVSKSYIRKLSKINIEDNAWENLYPNNPELQAWVNHYMSLSSEDKGKKRRELEQMKEKNGEIEKAAGFLHRISRLLKNPDQQIMTNKLAEIKARHKLLKEQGEKLTDPKFREDLLEKMRKRLVKYQEIHEEISNFRENSGNPILKLKLSHEIILMNSFLSILKANAQEDKNSAINCINAAKEVEEAKAKAEDLFIA